MSLPDSKARPRQQFGDFSRRGFLTSTAAGATALSANMGAINALQSDAVTKQLKQQDKRVIPVLVGGAQMPPADELPGVLQPLAMRNAVELSESRWDYDIGRLIDTLKRR